MSKSFLSKDIDKSFFSKNIDKSFFNKNMAVLILASLVLGFLPALPARAGDTLYADISADPSSGTVPLNNVDLTAVVSGTATGPITYRFDCTSDGAWDKVMTLNQSAYTAVDLCNYSTAGNYTATVKVERGVLSFQGTIAILVQAQPLPTVDLKVNGSDTTITIPYNTAATLSWTSTNATSCTAAGDWSGAKSTSSSESTGNLTNNKSYTLSCTGPGGGPVSDTVSVNISAQPTLYVVLETSPNVGVAPLSGVNLRATVTGAAAGLITYKFDCASDGSWDYQTITNDIQVQTGPICSYPSAGTYRAKTQVQRGGLTVEGTSTVIATQTGNQPPQLFVTVQAQPNSGTAPFASTLTAAVSGTVTGVVTYRFDCTSDGSWEYSTTIDANSATYSCSYNSANTYTARVRAERGGLTVWGSSIILAQ